jgi:hypothetical protein
MKDEGKKGHPEDFGGRFHPGATFRGQTFMDKLKGWVKELSRGTVLGFILHPSSFILNKTGL